MKGKYTMNEKWKDMTSMQKAGFIIVCLGALLMLVGVVKPEFFPVNMTLLPLW